MANHTLKAINGIATVKRAPLDSMGTKSLLPRRERAHRTMVAIIKTYP
jgi:hypothetical protein